MRVARPARPPYSSRFGERQECAMAEKTDGQPDPKAVEKRIKDVSDVAKRLESCKKQLDEATKAVKELEKLVK
jgi:hypothetical protein